MRTTSPLIGLTLSVLVAGCGSDPPLNPSGTTVVDSAGVQIVESPAPLLLGDAAWRVAEEPSVIAGLSSEETEGLFRVGRAHILSDGRFAVINHGTNEVKYFESDGAFQQATGGRGEGPGEFMMLFETWRLPGDTLVAYDRRLARLTRFGPDGSLLGTVALAANPPPPRVIGLLSGGAVGLIPQPPDLSGPEGTVIPMTETFVTLSPAGAVVDTIATLPGMPLRTASHRGQLVWGPRPFEVKPVYWIHGDHLYHGPSDAFQVRVYSPEGTLIRVIRRPDPDLTLTAEMVAGRQAVQREAARARGPEALQSTEQSLASAIYPERFPAYDYLLVDTSGNLWVRGQLLPPYEIATWSVFGPGGRWLTDVRMPGEIRPRVMTIGEDYILTRERDDNDLGYVARYELIKP